MAIEGRQKANLAREKARCLKNTTPFARQVWAVRDEITRRESETPFISVLERRRDGKRLRKSGMEKARGAFDGELGERAGEMAGERSQGEEARESPREDAVESFGRDCGGAGRERPGAEARPQGAVRESSAKDRDETSAEGASFARKAARRALGEKIGWREPRARESRGRNG